jgi:hypothetical protein
MSRSSILLEMKCCAGIKAYLFGVAGQIKLKALLYQSRTQISPFYSVENQICVRGHRGLKEYHGVLLS